jgi:hypothetical protein
MRPIKERSKGEKPASKAIIPEINFAIFISILHLGQNADQMHSIVRGILIE